jgi:hypothetical protein
LVPKWVENKVRNKINTTLVFLTEDYINPANTNPTFYIKTCISEISENYWNLYILFNSELERRAGVVVFDQLPDEPKGAFMLRNRKEVEIRNSFYTYLINQYTKHIRSKFFPDEEQRKKLKDFQRKTQKNMRSKRVTKEEIRFYQWDQFAKLVQRDLDLHVEKIYSYGGSWNKAYKVACAKGLNHIYDNMLVDYAKILKEEGYQVDPYSLKFKRLIMKIYKKEVT